MTTTRNVPLAIAVCVIVCLSCLPLRAQLDTTLPLSTPLFPAEYFNQHRIGVFFGPTFNSQSGSFFTDCGCTFSNGVDAAFVIGGLYEYRFAEFWTGGIRVGLESRSVTAAFRENEVVPLVSQQTSETFDQPVLFRHQADITLSTLSFTPYIQFAPFRALFFQLGFSPHLLNSSSIKHDKELLQRTAKLPTGETVLVDLEGTDETVATIEDGDLPETNSFQFSMALSSGIEIRLSESVFIFPMLQYHIPFTSVSERGEDFKVKAFQMLFGAKVDL